LNSSGSSSQHLFSDISNFFWGYSLFICQRERRASKHKHGERQAEGEAGFLLSKEPDVGLDPRTLDHDLS